MSDHTVPKLTAPDQVPLVRQLIAHAKAAGYHHVLYQIDDGPIEHNWRTVGGEHEIALQEGRLTYTLQMVRLLQADVDSPQQAADLLAAYGVAPVGLSSAYEAGQLAAAADIDAMLGGRNGGAR